MKKLREETVPNNTGWAAELKKGQIIRIAAVTTVDFVAFSLHNLRERFDQARTKVYNMKIFISTGQADEQGEPTPHDHRGRHLRRRDPRSPKGHV